MQTAIFIVATIHVDEPRRQGDTESYFFKKDVP